MNSTVTWTTGDNGTPEEALAAFRSRNRSMPLSVEARAVIGGAVFAGLLALGLGLQTGDLRVLGLCCALASPFILGSMFVIYREKVSGVRPDRRFIVNVVTYIPASRFPDGMDPPSGEN